MKGPPRSRLFADLALMAAAGQLATAFPIHIPKYAMGVEPHLDCSRLPPADSALHGMLGNSPHKACAQAANGATR